MKRVLLSTAPLYGGVLWSMNDYCNARHPSWPAMHMKGSNWKSYCHNEHVSESRRTRLNDMATKFPQCPIGELERYLKARSWDVERAAEMLQESIAWKSQNFPVSLKAVEKVVDQKCFLLHGTDRDGDPVIYFRWGLYNSSRIPSSAYVMTICHLMNYAFETQPSPSASLTVFVDLSVIPGESNQYADLEFLQEAIKVASNNYPERLKKLILYPFPWYGMTVWNCVKIFIDQRTQSKLLFVPLSESEDGEELPPRISSIIDPQCIPSCIIGGKYQDELLDIKETFRK